MPLRDLSKVTYIPLLSLRPAEARALEELPERDKDELLPVFPLRPWMNAHYLDSALSRIETAYGNRPFVTDIAEPEEADKRRPVHDELDALRTPTKGYDLWCRFIEDHTNFIPALQYSDLSELAPETKRLYALGRGLLIHIKKPALPYAGDIAKIIAGESDGGKGLCVLLDFERETKDLLMKELEATGFGDAVYNAAPVSYVALSASSFPDTFVDISNQDIFERILFNAVREKTAATLIYSDRGSARAERQIGGGGVIPPRIDYAGDAKWDFFRSDTDANRQKEYQKQAKRAIAHSCWDQALRVWGTQMIERTALGDDTAITSQARATAARINIHLHRQLHYGDPGALYQTDEEWVD